MNNDFMVALDALLEEKNINKEELLEAIETSIATSYQKNYKTNNEVQVVLDRLTGEITVYERKDIVEEVEDSDTQISLEEARKINPNFQIGDIYQHAITPREFGRIAAQNAKQMIMQRIKDAEKNKIYEEFAGREEEMLNGKVSRIERGNVFIDLGQTEALLPPGEQVPTETYKQGERLKVYVLSVRKTPKGPQIKVSRSHPGLIKRLFEEEVPEIYENVIDIRGVSREPGFRSKIAVSSNDDSIDAVGSCVGQKGVRVQSIIDELHDEKIDVINFSEDPSEFLKNALSPARIEKILANTKDKNAIVIVDDFQLSLAIGKEGQNVRLAAKLTGWKIDIKSQSAYEQLLQENPNFEEEFMMGANDIVSEDSIPDLFLDDDQFMVADVEEVEPIDEIIESDNEALNDLEDLFE